MGLFITLIYHNQKKPLIPSIHTHLHTMSTVTEKPAPTGNGLNRKTSRKGKKAWRKNVDIAEIEENLSELRDEERTTG